MSMLDYQKMLDVAIEEAKKGLAEGGIPIGSALFDEKGNCLGRGHNQRVQKKSVIRHAEMDALEETGRRKDYSDTILVTTLSPWYMCSGTSVLYKIPKIIIGENVNFMGGEDLLKEKGVELIYMNSQECIDLLAKFIKEKPELWGEDICEKIA